MRPLNREINLNEIPEHGRFGGIRKHDIHTGVDLYCEEGTAVYAISDGKIVNMGPFTGSKAGTDWWEDTDVIAIRHFAQTFLYGEITIAEGLKIGDEVKEGQIIGSVKRVLKKDKGLPMTMLHIEMYGHKYEGLGETWNLDGIRPNDLLNVEHWLSGAE